MALLDRFRSRPAWEDPDTETRLQAVLQLPASDAELLAAIAKGDDQAAVRRAAVKKLQDPALLAAVCREDPDAAVREEAALGLLQLAQGGDTGPGIPALAALSQARHLVAVAREGRSPELRRRAFERLEDARSLGAVAKTAQDPALRLASLIRLTEAEQLADVAGKSAHRDVAVAAVERIDRIAALQAIAAHARNKAAGRRARARLEELTGAPQPITVEERRSADLELCKRVEVLEGLPDVEALASAVAGARQEWSRIASHDAELTGRFQQVCRRHEQRVEREREEAAERDALERAEAEAVAARAAVCERIEALAGEAVGAGLAAAGAEWEALPAHESQAVEELSARFEAAEKAARERHAAWLSAGEQRARLEELCGELEQRSEAGSAEGTRGLRSEARALVAVAGVDPELQRRQAAVEARFAEGDAALRAEREREQRENRQRLEELCARIEQLVGEESPALGPAREALREGRAALEAPGPLARADRETLLARLRSARSALYPKLQELQDADEWRRFGNAAVQQELCVEVEALVERADLDAVAKQLRRVRDRWKQAASAPREEAEALWERFKTSRDAVQARVDVHLRQRAEEHARNLELKRALCEKAEALKESTDWTRTAEQLKQLQLEWKGLGPVARKHSNAVWKRFRAACDHFFEARKSDLSKRKEEWASNLTAKRVLCEKAEGLKDSTDWDATAAAFRSLQTEWKQTGPVRRDRSEAIWQQFRAACDVFFERYRRRDDIARDTARAGFEALCGELEALLPAADAAAGEPPAGLREQVDEVHRRWRAAGAPPRGERGLPERYATLRHRVVEAYPSAFRGSELDPEANRSRAEKLIARVERLAASAPDPASAQDLATRLREALAANTIGGGETRKRQQEELQAVQAAWSRLGPLTGDVGRSLEQRFNEACRRAKA